MDDDLSRQLPSERILAIVTIVSLETMHIRD